MPNTLIRDTGEFGYLVYDNGKGSIIIRANRVNKTVLRPQMSLYLKRKWDASTWEQLKDLDDSSFNIACCWELGIAAVRRV
jgi:hypothetical protein